jgi:hypothetical protein
MRMSPEERRQPWFAIKPRKSPVLEEQGAYPWTFEVATILRFVVGKDSGRLSAPLSFVLDTGAFASLIPEVWLRDWGLQPFLGKLSTPLSFTTAAGTGSGRLARAVHVQFPMAPADIYSFDFVVSPNLNNREYGLIALRDVIRQFDIVTRGEWMVAEDGRPLVTPDLVLIPRTDSR